MICIFLSTNELGSASCHADFSPGAQAARTARLQDASPAQRTTRVGPVQRLPHCLTGGARTREFVRSVGATVPANPVFWQKTRYSGTEIYLRSHHNASLNTNAPETTLKSVFHEDHAVISVLKIVREGDREKGDAAHVHAQLAILSPLFCLPRCLCCFPARLRGHEASSPAQITPIFALPLPRGDPATPQPRPSPLICFGAAQPVRRTHMQSSRWRCQSDTL